MVSTEQYRLTDKGKMSAVPSIRKSKLKKRYNITLDEYNAMLDKQGNVCAICKKKCPSGKNPAVDHDHTTKEVRGLLCRRCNRGIGSFDDNAELLTNAANYLEKN